MTLKRKMVATSLTFSRSILTSFSLSLSLSLSPTLSLSLSLSFFLSFFCETSPYLVFLLVLLIELSRSRIKILNTFASFF
jgi:hypothetical protein